MIIYIKYHNIIIVVIVVVIDAFIPTIKQLLLLLLLWMKYLKDKCIAFIYQNGKPFIQRS